MNLLIDIIKETKKYSEYIENINIKNSPVMITGLTFTSKSFFLLSTISSIIGERKKMNEKQGKDNDTKNIYYYIVENEIDIDKKKNDIEYFAKDLGIEVLDFPKKDIRDFDIISESLEIYTKRMNIFNKIIQNRENMLKNDIIIILSIESLMQRIIPFNILANNKIKLKKDDEISQKEIMQKLQVLGYKREDIAENAGEFSKKGGILDIANTEEEGYRVEFWGDTITSIRTYSNISQKSLKERQEVEILPLTEYIFEKNIGEVIENIRENNYFENKKKKENKKNKANIKEEKDEIEKILTRKNSRKKIDYTEEINEDIERLEQGEINQLVEKYIDYFYENEEYLTDYILEKDYIFFDEYNKIFERSKGILIEAENQNVGLIERKRLVNQALDSMCDYENILKKIVEKEIYCIYLENEKIKEFDKYNNIIKKNKYEFEFLDYSFLKTELQNLEEILIKEQEKNEQIYIIAYENYNYILEDIINKNKNKNKSENEDEDEEENENKNKELKKEESYLKNNIQILKGKISKGFRVKEEKKNYLVISVDSETARKNEKRAGKNSLFTNAENIIFADLEQGDYIVHKVNGIGRFIEIKRVEVQGISKDYIKIEYRDSDYLYVPTDDLSNVRKFIGAARK